MDGSRVIGGAGYMYPEGRGRDKWIHMAASWGGGQIRFYANGKYIRSGVVPEDARPWDNEGFRFTLADPASTREKNNKMAMDDLMIFNRPLDDAEIKSLYRLRTAELKSTKARIPLIKSELVIDGIFNAREWKNSTEVTDFVDTPFGNLSGKKVRANISYSKDALNIAVRSRDMGVSDEGNNVEVLVLPENGSPLRFILGIDGSLTQYSDKAPFNGIWNAEVATQGDKETGVVFEISIPWETLKFTINEENSLLYLNIIRSFSDNFGDRVSWAPLPGTDVPKEENFGQLILGGERPVLSIDSLGRLDYASMALNISANTAVSDWEEVLTAKIMLQPSDLREIVDPETFVVTYSGTQLRMDGILKIEDGTGNLSTARSFSDTDINLLVLEISDSSGDIVYSARRPFVPRPPITSEIKLFPSSDTVEIYADISNYSEPAAEGLLAEIVLKDASGLQVGTHTVKDFPDHIGKVSMPLSELSVGTIEVTATLVHDGKNISRFDNSFDNIERGPWYKNDLGRDEIVINPFTPVEVDGQKISVWGRTYIWEDSLFPVQVISSGEQILAGPIELVAGDNPSGKANPAKVRIAEHSDTMAVVESSGSIGDMLITARHLIEYDGMCLTELYIEAGASLEGLQLFIPFIPSQSTLYHWFGNAGSVNETEKDFRGPPMQGSTELPFRNTIWLGNEYRGMTWFAENPRGWRLQGNPRPIAINSDDTATSLSIKFSAGPFEVEQHMHLVFGIIATPVKQMPENWRFMQQGRDWSYDWFRAFTRSNNDIANILPGWKEFHAGTIAGKGYASRVNEGQTVQFFVPYQRPDWINTDQPESSFFAEEWDAGYDLSGTDGAGMSVTHRRVCLASEWQDFMLYYAVKAYRENEMTGFYFDGGLPSSCNNINHGCGWKDGSGNLQSNYPLLGWREFYKRLATALYMEGRPYLLWVHNSNNMQMPTLSFVDMVWDGEQFSSNPTQENKYTEQLTLPYFRAEFLGQQFGLPVQWLAFTGPMGQTDAMLALALVHGMAHNTLAAVLGRGHGWHYEYVRGILALQDEFGVSADDSQFIPYWETSGIISFDEPDLKVVCSIWRREGKSLLVIANSNPEEKTAEITIDMDRLGLQGEISAFDIAQDTEIQIEGTLLKLHIPGASWKMIKLSKELRKSAS